ncbi:MAG: ABC transporter permease [Kineosporiaceae bacterium]
MSAERRGAGGLGALIASEVRLVLGRRRTRAVLALLASVPVLVAVAVKLAALPDDLEGPPLLDRATENGLFVGVASALLCVSVLLPLAACVVAGDAVAGEAAAGTLRYLLLAPVGRTRLLAVKSLVSLGFAALVAVVPMLVGGLVGAALFGVHPVPLLSGDAVGTAECLRRAALVSAYLAVSLVGVVALAILASTCTDSPLTATAVAVLAAVTSQVLAQVPQLEAVHPWLFTAHWFDVADLLRTPIAWDSFLRNAGVQAGWAAVALTAAWARFTTSDVRS